MAGDQDGLMVPTLKSGVAGVTGGLALLPHLDLGVAAIPTGAGLERGSLAVVDFVVVVQNSAGPYYCMLF